MSRSKMFLQQIARPFNAALDKIQQRFNRSRAGSVLIMVVALLVLLALLRLGERAYGLAVRQEIAERAEREVTIGAVYATLDRLAKALPPGDPRTLPQKRADILADLLLGRHPHRTASVDVNVTVAASTLAVQLGHPRAGAMIALGALAAATGVVSLEALVRGEVVFEST